MPTKTPEKKEIRKAQKKRTPRASRSQDFQSHQDHSKELAAATNNKFPLIPGLVLVVITIILYSPVGSHPFIHYDDQQYVYENAHIKAGLSWGTFTWALTATDADNWHPVTWLSHALDSQLFGIDPAGHHWVNVIIHAANALLLFWLLWRVTGATWRSLIAASLFALHPLNVESVAWVAERKNVLSTFFFLLTLGAYGYYARRPRIGRYLLVAVLFVLGLAAKPMVITLPFVLLLLDFWPLQRIENWSGPSAAFPVPQTSLSRLVLEKLPLLALSVGSAVITLFAQTDAEVPSMALPFSMRLITSVYAYGTYLWKMIWPARLALIYPHPGRSLPFWGTSLAALTIGIALWFAWTQRSKRPYWAVGWLWFLGTAVPIIGLVQVGVQVAADRYAYLTLIGIFVAVVWGASDLADRWSVGVVPRAIAVAVVLCALTVTTWRQISYWQSTADLWTHALQVTQNNSMAEDFLANELITLGRYEEGMEHLRNFARMEPLDPSSHARVGADYLDRGQIADATREFEASIRASKTLREFKGKLFEPDQVALTYANLAVCYMELGDNAKAQENAANALQTDSDAITRLISGLGQYLQQHPVAAGYIRLGILLREFGHEPEAQQAFFKARQLNPSVAPALTSGIGTKD
jgi:protein O-mannosyl-transferase